MVRDPMGICTIAAVKLLGLASRRWLFWWIDSECTAISFTGERQFQIWFNNRQMSALAPSCPDRDTQVVGYIRRA